MVDLLDHFGTLWFTHYPLIVALFFIAVVVGAVAYRSLPLEAAPEVKIPIMVVSTVYPGVAPEDMERLVTNVVEAELKDLKGLKSMTSSSAESVSLVTIEFETNVELDVAYQKVRDKVDRAKRSLPADAEDPVIIEINVSEFPMMLYEWPVYADMSMSAMSMKYLLQSSG